MQGRLAEFRRLMFRAAGSSDNRLRYEANDWLMDTMQRGRGAVGDGDAQLRGLLA